MSTNKQSSQSKTDSKNQQTPGNQITSLIKQQKQQQKKQEKQMQQKQQPISGPTSPSSKMEIDSFNNLPLFSTDSKEFE